MMRIVAVAIVAGVVACAPAGAGRSPLPAHGSLMAADREYAAAAQSQGLADAFLRWAADDVSFLAPGVDVLRGKDAARAWLTADSASRAAVRWSAIHGGVSADGRSGYTFGTGVGAAVHRRYIAWWTRPGAEWRIQAFALIPAGDTALTPPAGFFAGAIRGTPSPRGAAEREAVMQADRDFAAMALARSPREAFETYAAPWAVLASGPEYGPEQIGRAFSRPAVIAWGPVLGGAAASGDLGYTIGLAKYTFQRPDGTSANAFSKYLSVWMRQPDGTWKYVVDGGNSRPAPITTASP